mmetsp:Transcript_99578/g.197384  ORF Transcript_99578/g.197384 Transcript_99578/m.197384 type:complete len:82 (+) Transcript_99578:566-811(+)
MSKYWPQIPPAPMYMQDFVQEGVSPRPSVVARTNMRQARQSMQNIGARAPPRAVTVSVRVVPDGLKVPLSSSELRVRESPV